MKTCLFKSLTLLGAAAFSLAITACSKGPVGLAQTAANDKTSWTLFAANDLVVVDSDMQALAGAKILIGSELGAFEDNYIVTDDTGHVALPAGWTAAEPLTVEAPGYVRATYYGQVPGAHTYRLRKQVSAAQYLVQGTTLGHTIVDKDGFIDFGLVIPALTRNDLLSFDLNNVISTQMDTITVVGQDVQISSNVTLPRQKESYILPVTIEKPNYRLFFSETGTQRVFAARGRFPFKNVVNELRNNKPFAELINYFAILGGGVKDINITRSITQVDLSVKDLNFTSKARVTAPQLGADEMMMAIGVAQMSEYLVPTDVKRVLSGDQMQISTLDQKALLFSVLKKTADLESGEPGADRLSAVLIPAANAQPQFLAILADPKIAGNGDVMVQKISTVRGVNKVATYAVLSSLQDIKKGKDTRTLRRPSWEVYANDWLEVVSLPKWPEADPQPAKKRWEVNLLGSLNASQVELGPAMINDATHVTHTSLDF